MQFYHRQSFANSILSWLHQVYGKILYLPTCIFTRDSTSVVKIVSTLKGSNWGVPAPQGGLGWNDHTYHSNGIIACLPLCLGQVKEVKALGCRVIYVVTLDGVKVCLVGPHPICVKDGIFLCFCWGMGHWLRCTWPPWWSWWCHAAPCLWWWSSQHW